MRRKLRSKTTVFCHRLQSGRACKSKAYVNVFDVEVVCCSSFFCCCCCCFVLMLLRLLFLFMCCGFWAIGVVVVAAGIWIEEAITGF